MRQGLQLRLSQNLALTPQLQQAIRLLQLSTLELNQEIEALMQTNPLLEHGDDHEDEYGNPIDEKGLDEPATPDSQHALDLGPPDELGEIDFDVRDSAGNVSERLLADTVQPAEADESDFNEEYSVEFSEDYDEFSSAGRWDENTTPADDDSDFRPQETLQISLREHLLSQLKLMPLSDRDQTLVLLLVDSVNEDGYLEVSLDDLVEQLPLALEVDAVELQTALHLVQHLDPPGVGARNLSECLLLQLDVMPEDVPHVALAKTLVQEHLAILASRDFIKLRRKLGCDEDTLKQVQCLITRLNPRPGSVFSTIGSEQYIQHEVIVKKVKGIWIASLNEAVIPKLKINQLYAGILKRNRDSSTQYLQSQMQEAKWMIKNIQQRFSTILRVSQAIVDRQRNFLEYGEVAMRPLVLREIADELDLHESTISRVTTNKYMLTPRGIFELKYFFGSSVSTESGGTCSAIAIRALIKQLVDQESPQKPYSDNQITNLLVKQGIVVARRTIAKYRESLNIAPANLRKSL